MQFFAKEIRFNIFSKCFPWHYICLGVSKSWNSEINELISVGILPHLSKWTEVYLPFTKLAVPYDDWHDTQFQNGLNNFILFFLIYF